MTTYILIAVQMEERDLVAALGAECRDYRRDVPMLLPRPRVRAPRTAGQH
jgi:methanethiol S-methyltransferase